LADAKNRHRLATPQESAGQSRHTEAVELSSQAAS